ncbi:MAG TPA: ankyrin repeat domain-containing protein [Gammaproteobacteria bacterium]
MADSNLPARPNLEQYKKQAKELLKRCKAGDAASLQRIKRQHPRFAKSGDAALRAAKLALADMQLVIAREHGFQSWASFADEVAARGSGVAPHVWKEAEDAVVDGDIAALERLLAQHPQIRKARPQSSWLGGLTPDYSSRDARTIIARNHEFAAWPEFAAFAEALRDKSSPVARFEAAVDAIIAGDVAALERLLRDDPELIRARSKRKHRSMLLHYVGSNGVESWRQRTPKNIASIARLLLEAGADVDAVADMYGGSKTLGLAATSMHPAQAGVLDELVDVLVEYGAAIVGPGLVNGCLANGRRIGAEMLARRGAPLDFEGAAGVGRLDLVRGFFDGDGTSTRIATAAQLRDAFTWACEFGRADVVEFLLAQGMDVSARLKHHGQTGLHWAACGGHVDTVKALLRRGAPVDANDETWGGTPLAWTLFAWNDPPPDVASHRYYEVVALLVAAGATVAPEWLQDERVAHDARMLAALDAAERPES